MKITQVVVIGLGRFGTTVATTLYQMGHDVLAIDKDPVKVQELAGQVTYAVAADATDEDALRELGIEKFEYAVVAIGTNTEASIMVSVLLKSLDINTVVGEFELSLNEDGIHELPEILKKYQFNLPK